MIAFTSAARLELCPPVPAPRAPGEASAELGGKGRSLLRLEAAGCRVPRFRIVPAACFASALGAAVGPLRDALADRGHAQEADCEARAAAIAAVLGEAAVVARLRAAIGRSLAGTLAARRRYAVRSSAMGEDSDAASFAGLLDTRLNVPPAAAVDAVLDVWRSAFSARVLAYHARRGLRGLPPAAAVIVQEMVRPVAAGVLFTRAPDDAGECIVCAGYGLGEGIVSDRVGVDTYRIDRHCGSIRHQVADKPTRVAAARVGGTRLEPVTAAKRARPALADRTLRRLRKLGLRLEAAFGTALDVEFAVDRWRRIHVLQARPITASGRRSAAPRVWDNANVVESYPGLTLPLTFSFAQAGYAAAFRGYMRRRSIDYFPFRSPLRHRPELFENLIGLIGGRVYYNLLSWYEMMSVLPGFERVRASWDRMIGVHGRAETRVHRLPLPARVLAAVYCVWKLLRLRATVAGFNRRFAAVYAAFATTELAAFDASALVAQYEALKNALADDWSRTLDNDFAAMAYYEAVHALCRRWVPVGSGAIANALLRHAPDMESLRPVHALESLALQIARTPSLLALFAGASDDEVLAAVHSAPAHRAFAAALQAYLAAFGDRCTQELKLDQPTFRERPALLIATLRPLIACPGGRAAPQHGTASDAAHLAPVGGIARRSVLAWVARRARFAIASRENMRFARTRVFGLARRLFAELGSRFAEQGLLGAPEDIHYLTVGEICAYVRGTSVTGDLAALVALRRAEYQAHAGARRPGRLATHGIPYGADATGGDDADGDFGSDASAQGTPCAGGRAEAAAWVVRDPHSKAPPHRHVLVAESTDPGWVFLMMRAEAMVVERGSVLSHTAIIGRELGIPTVVGVAGATQRITDGARLAVDGATGRLQWR
jgi:rifampicin phosphotransferase